MNIDEEMECCYNCPFLVSASNTIDTMFICDINDYEIDKDLFYRHIKPNTCPIVAILPNNHGRLIDADEVHTKSKELYKTVQHSSERKMGYLIAMNTLIIDAPTVLEASKDEHD